MDFPTPEHDSFLVIPHTFTATRIYEEDSVSQVSPTIITLGISCAPIDDESISAEEMGTKAMIGFQRLKVWLDGILEHIVMIDMNSELLAPMQEKIGNQIMIVPGKPDDALLAVLLHAKISAITEGLLEIYTISLKATDTDFIERIYRCPSKEYPLPGIEYFSGESVYETPWWTRPTIDVGDYERSEDDETIEWHTGDPLAEIGKEFLTDDTEADIIVFDAWKNKDK